MRERRFPLSRLRKGSVHAGELELAARSTSKRPTRTFIFYRDPALSLNLNLGSLFPLKRTALAATEASGTSLPQKTVTDSEAGAFMRS